MNDYIINELESIEKISGISLLHLKLSIKEQQKRLYELAEQNKKLKEKLELKEKLNINI